MTRNFTFDAVQLASAGQTAAAPLVAVAEQVGVEHQLGAKFADCEPMHEDEYAGESRRVGFPFDLFGGVADSSGISR